MPRILRLQTRTLRDLATGHPGAAAVFRRCGIAFCEGAGERSLVQAVATSDVSLRAMLGALEDLIAAVERGAPGETEALVDFIVSRHHAPHRAVLPDLVMRAGQAERALAGRADGPRGLAELLRRLGDRMEEHMRDEEREVFPRMIARGRGATAGEVARLREEHADMAQAVLEVEHVTRGYRPPAGAEDAWGRLYGDVEQFMDDIVAHFYLEEQALFPRFGAETGIQATRAPQRS